MTTMTRRQMIEEADQKRELAVKAYRDGDAELCGAFMVQARDRHIAAGLTCMTSYCNSWIAAK